MPSSSAAQTPVSATLTPVISPPPASADAAMVDQLQYIALQLADVAVIAPDFVEFDVGPTKLADRLLPPQESDDRFGRLGGWKARFRRPSDVTTGILLVDSRVDLFSDSAGATQDFNAYAARYATDAARTGAALSSPAVGDQATLSVETTETGGQLLNASIAWRRGPFTGQIVVSGSGAADLESAAVQLAQAVDQHMTSPAVP